MNRWVAAAMIASLAAPVSGCGGDIRLGGQVVDAGLDASDSTLPLFAGETYTLQFVGPALVECDGTLFGAEASFTPPTRAMLGFVDGPVTLSLSTATTLTISGATISSGWGVPSVDLVPDNQTAPVIWDTLVEADHSDGPMATTREVTYLGVDIATGMSATGIEAQAGTSYETVDLQGMCALTFDVRLTRP